MTLIGRKGSRFDGAYEIPEISFILLVVNLDALRFLLRLLEQGVHLRGFHENDAGLVVFHGHNAALQNLDVLTACILCFILLRHLGPL